MKMLEKVWDYNSRIFSMSNFIDELAMCLQNIFILERSVIMIITRSVFPKRCF